MMLTSMQAGRTVRTIGLVLGGVTLGAAGCGGFNAAQLGQYGLTLFPLAGSTPDTTVTDTTNTGGDGGGFFDGIGVGVTDPCLETVNNKFVTVSLRNRSDDFVHYFLAFVAFVDTDTQAGAVCVDDIELYTNFGYQFIPDGSERAFGDYCIEGPALLYFHRSGNFRSAGADAFASAIPPAQGTSPTYDSFFGAGGTQVPVPEQILFHNPGTGEGAALQVAQINANPCDGQLLIATSPCSLDAFYYVDDNDLLAGSTALGPGSARRTPNEIQGTGCTVGFQEAFHSLAASGTSAGNAGDNEFIRGGTIEFVFIREDLNPPVPQLLWRVTDATGSVVHELDPRAPL